MDASKGDLASQIAALKVVKQNPNLRLVWSMGRQIIEVRKHVPFRQQWNPEPKDAA